MAEATVETNPTAQAEAEALQKMARALDRARMQQIGGYHFAMVTGRSHSGARPWPGPR